jgi:hypothetical protein
MKIFVICALFITVVISAGFTPPQIGETITVHPRIGVPVTGTLEELERSAVVIDGRRYEARDLSEESWALLFEEYYTLQQQRARRAHLESQSIVLGRNLQVGQLGRFGCRSATRTGQHACKGCHRVVQVLGADEMIVEIFIRTVSRGRTQLTFERIMGDTVWIKGYSTRGLVDGGGLHPEGLFRVTGTDSYRTVLGSSRTLMTLEPIE